MRRLLDYDPLTGITQYFHHDDMTGKWAIETVQDVEPILDFNKEAQNNESYSKNGIKNEFWHFARIPVIVQEKWLREDGINIFDKDHWPKVRKKLNDPDYLYLKTTTGKL